MALDPALAGLPLFALNLRWPCGHARTAANTRACGKAGPRCRRCRIEIDKNSRRRRKASANAGDARRG